MNNENKRRFEKFQMQMSSIHEQLEFIANRTMSMALMNKHKKLIDEMDKLIKEYEKVQNNKLNI